MLIREMPGVTGTELFVEVTPLKPKSSRKPDLTQSRTVDYFESVVRRRIKVACMSAVVGGSSRTVAIVYECVVANLGSG